MTNIALIVETALLLLAAYLLGCVFGYGARRVFHAARGTRQVVQPVEVITTIPRQAPRPAARLAASVDDLPAPVHRPPEPVLARPNVAAKPAATRPRKTRSIDPTPTTLAAPRDGKADNLKQIKEIGPKIKSSLNAMGIYHIDQIAAWTKANIDWVDAQLAFKGRIRRERWVEQAADMTRAKAA